MYPKCSLNGYNTYLQIFGLLALVIILIIVGIYYMRVYHKNILEKYENTESTTIDLDLSLDYKDNTAIQPGDRSTYPLNKYPGANKTDKTTDKYKLRECKVYFTDNIGGCDAQPDNGGVPKTCSYTFNGWQEFDTYTDKKGGIIEYPKKIFNEKISNTDELVNSYFTSKCFKEFDNEGLGNAQQFEYSENDLIKYDSKGLQSDTEKDTNIFGGKKYTSIQFLNNGKNTSDNFKNLMDSICSVKYVNKHSDLTNKQFYKFILNGDNTISNVIKVKLNDMQTNFDSINDNAILDFASLGQSGIRIYKTNNIYKLQAFRKSDNITKPVKIYKFTYASNLCTDSKIKSYTTRETVITVSNFVNFTECKDSEVTNLESAETGIDLSVLQDNEKESFTKTNEDNTQAILNLIDQKILTKIQDLKNASQTIRNSIEAEINRLREAKLTKLREIDRYIPKDKTFLGVINLKKEGSFKGIFDYKPGYVNTKIEEYNIQEGINSINVLTDGVYTNGVILIFPHIGNELQKGYNFIVPGGTTYKCDILLVGGGGAGGNAGGSGGGGDVLEFKDIELKSGNYNILVGDGGEGNSKDNPNKLCKCGYPGRVGNNTSITINNKTITAAGGGGGGSHGYEHWWDGGRGWVWSGCTPTETPTAKYIHPQNNIEMISSGGGGGGGNLGANGGSGNKVSGDGGKTDDNNGNSGGAGGGAAPPSEGGNGGNSSIRNPSYNGNGGKGIISSITGKKVEYGGGGAAGRWNGEVNRNGISSGGGGYQIWPTNYNSTPMSGGGGVSLMKGGSGVVIIKIYKKEKEINLDELYKKVPPSINQLINIDITKLEYNVITSFVYLQKGYYRFRADIGSEMSDNNFGNPNIKSAWLGIYDESNKGGDNKYKILKVFKYNNENRPSYLIPYLNIETNKFYKLIYFYVANNIKNTPFNLWYKYSSTQPNLELTYIGYSTDIISEPRVNSIPIGQRDKYMVFTTGSYTITIPNDGVQCDILIVGGGGGGGNYGGGGGGGGVTQKTIVLTSGKYLVTVGAGGNGGVGRYNPGENGGTSSITSTEVSGFLGLFGAGGGGGGTYNKPPNITPTAGSTQNRNFSSGGGGGGGASEGVSRGETGNGVSGNGGTNPGLTKSGGGGGATGNGGDATSNGAGNGGTGVISTITGSRLSYGGGGGGGTWTGGTPGTGTDGGGNGAVEHSGILPTSGSTTNIGGTGGGGGGGGGLTNVRGVVNQDGANGGSGIVIIRYRTITEVNKIPKSVTIKDSEKFNNDDNMYEPNKIIEIKDSLNSYLFSGEKETSITDENQNNSVYQHYSSTTMKDIFSTINYNNDNTEEWKNFQRLAYYFKKPSINFFNITDYDDKINRENEKLLDEISKLNSQISSDTIINGLKTLSTSIQNIDYNKLIGVPNACLNTDNLNRFIHKSGFENTDKTYDKISIKDIKTIDVLTPNLIPTIYIEAI